MDSQWYYPGLVFALCVALAFIDWRLATRRARELAARDFKRRRVPQLDVRDRKRIRGIVAVGLALAAFTWFVQGML